MRFVTVKVTPCFWTAKFGAVRRDTDNRLVLAADSNRSLADQREREGSIGKSAVTMCPHTSAWPIRQYSPSTKSARRAVHDHARQ